MSDLGALAFGELVARSLGGDAAARDALVRRFEARVRERVHRELHDDFRKHHRWMLALFSTRDVVQDVLAGVVAALGTAEFADEDAFAGYLSTMVKNRLRDAVRYHEASRRDARRAVRDGEVAVTAELADARGPAPALAAQIAEQAAVLAEVLEGFEPRRRALLTMRLVDETPYPEVAQKLGFASAETARQAFVDAQALLLVRLRGRGVRPPGETLR